MYVYCMRVCIYTYIQHTFKFLKSLNAYDVKMFLPHKNKLIYLKVFCCFITNYDLRSEKLYTFFSLYEEIYSFFLYICMHLLMKMSID